MSNRLGGCLLAILVCMSPRVAAAEDMEPETDAPVLTVPASFEFSRSDNSTGLPPLLSQPSEREAAVSGPVADGPVVSGVVVEETTRAEGGATVKKPEPHAGFGYNLQQGGLSWLVGHGDDFGMFSLESLPSLSAGEKSGLLFSASIHFLSGPSQTDMPPRLFDFQIGWQHRKWTSETFGYDFSARLGFFSDFEGSARKGLRFPGHAVGYYRWDPRLDLVLGIESFDRDDITLLPVAGVILLPRDDLRLELVFPRPRIEVQVSPKNSLYLAGELGGGTWAIERMTGVDDVVTYRDLRLLLGIQGGDDEGYQSGFEIGYVFGRDLSYRSKLGDYQPGDTVLFRLTSRY